MLLILTKSQFKAILNTHSLTRTQGGLLHDSENHFIGTADAQGELIQVSMGHEIYPKLLQTLNNLLFREDQKMKRDLIHKHRKQSSLKRDPRMFNKIFSKFEEAMIEELASDYLDDSL